MAQQLVLPEKELAAKAGATKAFALGLLAAALIAEVIAIIFWLFNRGFPIVTLTLAVVTGIVIGSITYWLVRAGKVRVAGYFFIISLLLEEAILTTMFGGFTGPMAISYLFPIVAAGMVIGTNAVFFAATIAAMLYLGMIGVERADLLPQFITLEAEDTVVSYLAIGTRLVFFYLVAFLSWFAASQLNQTLQSVRQYAGELQISNEKLQASEEELRVRNEELRATEEELRASNEELQATLDELNKASAYSEGLLKNMVDGLGVIDLEGKVIDSNAPLLEMFGLKKEDVLGLPLVQLLSQRIEPTEIEKLTDMIGQLMAGVTVGTTEMVITAKDGTQVTVSVAPSVVRDVKGNPIMLFAVMRDITERKRMEREIQDKNEQLEAQNEELRATEEELRASNEELRETQEQLIRSEKLAAIGQLAGGVGHELRNPLGAIKNAVYYIRGKLAKSELGQKEPRVMEFLDIMDDEINASNKIINDLLGFSRVGKPSVSLTRINRVIDDALARVPVPENIKLTKHLDTDLSEVEIDPDQIQQVLVNMILNAVQAMPEGGKLTIGAKEKDRFLEVKIADTGCGIPDEAVDKIFDPLFTTKAKGIGLGLAVCKSIIDRHDGNIEVKSKPGKGTTFSIKLPLKAA